MATWGYGLLGPVEVRVDDRPVPLPGVRQRLLLAMLLVNANRNRAGFPGCPGRTAR